MRNITKLTLLMTLELLFTACTSSASVLLETPSFKQGKQDGCTTATGEYKKNSKAWNQDKDYQDGWYYGRKNCHQAQG